MFFVVKKPIVTPITGGGPAKKANTADEAEEDADEADDESADDEEADDEEADDEEADEEEAVKYADAAVNTEPDKGIKYNMCLYL
jgi:hypothetical protein